MEHLLGWASAYELQHSESKGGPKIEVLEQGSLGVTWYPSWELLITPIEHLLGGVCRTPSPSYELFSSRQDRAECSSVYPHPVKACKTRSSKRGYLSNDYKIFVCVGVG